MAVMMTHTGKPRAFFLIKKNKPCKIYSSVLTVLFALIFPPPEKCTAAMRMILKPFQKILGSIG